MRRDSYWKQSAACVLALMLLLVSGGRAESFAMGGSYKAQAQTLYSPGKVIVADDEPAGGSGGSADHHSPFIVRPPVRQPRLPWFVHA